MSNRIEPAPLSASEKEYFADYEIDDSDRFKDISYIIWMQSSNHHRKNSREELLPESKIVVEH